MHIAVTTSLCLSPLHCSASVLTDSPYSSFSPIYAPSKTLDRIAAKYADQARALFDAGEPQRPLTAYVNYANGKETVEQVYGYEAWRQQKLKALKKKYDPENRFRFYNPIIR